VQFDLSDDQRALQAAARELLDGYASPAAVRARVDDGGGLDAKLWAAMVEQGWTGMAVPEDLGGLGLGWVELAVLLEQTGAHVAPAPFLQQAVALDVLVRAGGQDDLVRRLVAGEAIATVTAAPVALTAEGRLAGRPEPAGEPCVVLVDLRASGVAADRQPSMDLTRELAWLDVDGAPAIRLGGAPLAEALLLAGAVAHSCELLGASSRALELAVDYAKERHQFGRPIGSFQAVKHRCADMLVDVEGMRSTAYHAAWAIGAADPDASVAASTAKTWCADAGRRVMASSLQVHGGIGFTWEHDLHLFLKRAQLDQVTFGDARFHRDRLASLLRSRVEAGAPIL
jgi:alkylation response protein AidB-like acyl-CoA dehydrogenase